MLELIVRFLALIGLVVLGATTCHSETDFEEPSAPVLEPVDAQSLDGVASQPRSIASGCELE